MYIIYKLVKCKSAVYTFTTRGVYWLSIYVPGLYISDAAIDPSLDISLTGRLTNQITAFPLTFWNRQYHVWDQTVQLLKDKKKN